MRHIERTILNRVRRRLHPAREETHYYLHSYHHRRGVRRGHTYTPYDIIARPSLPRRTNLAGEEPCTHRRSAAGKIHPGAHPVLVFVERSDRRTHRANSCTITILPSVDSQPLFHLALVHSLPGDLRHFAGGYDTRGGVQMGGGATPTPQLIRLRTVIDTKFT